MKKNKERTRNWSMNKYQGNLMRFKIGISCENFAMKTRF